MNIFIGLKEISGYYHSLKKGFEELGIDATYVNIYPNPFNYDEDNKNILVKFTKSTYKLRIGKNMLIRIVGYVLNLSSRVILTLWALYKFDVFIFGFGKSFLNLNDLPILKLLKKKIIFIFHGSDSRSPYSDGAYLQNKANPTIYDCYLQTKKKAISLKKIEKYSDYIINHPPQTFLMSKKFIQYYCIGVPFSPKQTSDFIRTKYKDKFIILHSPSNKAVKGTDYIEEIIQSLKEEGYNIILNTLSGVSNSKVQEAIQNCDLVLDQLFSDVPLAGFGNEAANFGKGVITAGYFASVLDKIIPIKSTQPPALFCHPSEVREKIKYFIINKNNLEQYGLVLRNYVAKNYNPKKVAGNIRMLINNEFPTEWYYDPENIDYFDVIGIDKEKGKYFIKKYYTKYGIDGFFLNGKKKS